MRWIAIVFVVGCGGSPKHAAEPEDPAAKAREAERARIAAMAPASPYETRAVHGFRAPTACGQGPYRITVPPLGAAYGEQLYVQVCAPREVAGDYRFSREDSHGEPRHFGSTNDNAHCVASAAEVATRGTDAAPTNTAARPGGKAGKAAAPAKTAAPLALQHVTTTVGEDCPAGSQMTYVLHYTTESLTGDPPWDAKKPHVIELWSDAPMHLEGAMFVVIQRGVRAGMTLDAWKEYRAAYERWQQASEAYTEREVAAGRTHYIDMSAHTTEAPPAPRVELHPPKPSVHAEWIAGYWQRDREWIWSPGFWRVPDADIAAEQTVAAPVAPPPEKVAAPPPPPQPSAAVTLVWTPGYWAWNGAAYVWIAGAYRIPPKPSATWVAPRWAPRRGGVVLVPGGWSIRLGR